MSAVVEAPSVGALLQDVFDDITEDACDCSNCQVIALRHAVEAYEDSEREKPDWDEDSRQAMRRVVCACAAVLVSSCTPLELDGLIADAKRFRSLACATIESNPF